MQKLDSKLNENSIEPNKNIRRKNSIKIRHIYRIGTLGDNVTLYRVTIRKLNLQYYIQLINLAIRNLQLKYLNLDKTKKTGNF